LRELLSQLPNGVQELGKNWSHFFAVALNMTASVVEFMAKRKPFFFY
jgi:hypothetical protein